MTAGIKPKHQRLVLVVIALVALVGAGLLATWALSNQANFFYLPAQMKEDPPEVGQAVRLGGMVQPGSLEQLSDGITVSFVVSDPMAEDQAAVAIPVQYTGILPDLFEEGSGVVAEGELNADGTFVAKELLAKHDENYVPRELQEMDAHQKQEQVAASLEEGA